MLDNFCLAKISLTLVTIAIFLFIVIVLFGLIILINLNHLLSKNAPIATDLLIVEGWLPDYALEAAISEFKTGGYKTLITVGASLPRGVYLSEYKNFGELAGATILAMGFDKQKLRVVSTDYVAKCRTQNAAISLKKYLAKSKDLSQKMNVFTLGPHARRTWLVFSRVFSPTTVGIIATTPLAYDSQHWWQSSEGVRVVLAELIAYLYRRFFG